MPPLHEPRLLSAFSRKQLEYQEKEEDKEVYASSPRKSSSSIARGSGKSLERGTLGRYKPEKKDKKKGKNSDSKFTRRSSHSTNFHDSSTKSTREPIDLISSTSDDEEDDDDDASSSESDISIKERTGKRIASNSIASSKRAPPKKKRKIHAGSTRKRSRSSRAHSLDVSESSQDQEAVRRPRKKVKTQSRGGAFTDSDKSLDSIYESQSGDSASRRPTSRKRVQEKKKKSELKGAAKWSFTPSKLYTAEEKLFVRKAQWLKTTGTGKGKQWIATKRLRTAATAKVFEEIPEQEYDELWTEEDEIALWDQYTEEDEAIVLSLHARELRTWNLVSNMYDCSPPELLPSHVVVSRDLLEPVEYKDTITGDTVLIKSKAWGQTFCQLFNDILSCPAFAGNLGFLQYILLYVMYLRECKDQPRKPSRSMMRRSKESASTKLRLALIEDIGVTIPSTFDKTINELFDHTDEELDFPHVGFIDSVREAFEEGFRSKSKSMSNNTSGLLVSDLNLITKAWNEIYIKENKHLKLKTLTEHAKDFKKTTRGKSGTQDGSRNLARRWVIACCRKTLKLARMNDEPASYAHDEIHEESEVAHRSINTDNDEFTGLEDHDEPEILESDRSSRMQSPVTGRPASIDLGRQTSSRHSSLDVHLEELHKVGSFFKYEN